MVELKEWNKVRAVADYLGVCSKTIRRAVNAGHIGYLKVEGGIRIHRDTVKAYIASNMHESNVQASERGTPASPADAQGGAA